MKLKAILLLFCLLVYQPAHSQVDAESLSKDNQPPPEIEMKPEEDAPPPPEAPYPNAKTEEATPPAAKPVPAPAPTYRNGGVIPPAKPRTLGIPQKIPPSAPQRPLQLEKPYTVDENGDYHYKKSTEDDSVDVRKTEVKPKPVGKEGPLKITRPVEIKKNGDYFYGYEKPPHNRSASIKFGLLPAPDLKNKQTGDKFADLYTKEATGMVMFDYEWQFHRSYGDLGIRLGTGVYTVTGNGRFVNRNDPDRDPSFVPTTNFTFVMFPNTVNLMYHFRYSDTQFITPYVGAGGGLFTFTEIRDDNLAPKFGGAPVLSAVGGLNIMVDGLEPNSSRDLEANYGISHVYLNLEVMQIVGVEPDYNFTGTIINAGFNVEF